LAALAAAAPLWAGPGMVNTRAGGDSLFMVQRVYEMSRNLAAGVFPARWMSGAAYGLGYPAFNYYAALPYYLAALLHLFGLSTLASIKATQTLGFVLAGAFTYRLARRMGARPGGALLASAAYTLAPFHLVNVYVRGDALSEFWAMALIPGVLWALLELRRNTTAARAATLAGLYALLVLSHNISALVFSPIAAAWLLAEALGRGVRGRRFFTYGAAALGLGLLLSAWFWAPALREASLVQLDEQTTGYFHYAGHFRGADLAQWRAVHDYTVAPNHDPFDMALWQVVLAAASLIVLWLRLRRGACPERSVYLAAALLALTTWLMTSSSAAAWEAVPLLPYVQFPWRLLGLQALAIALLGAPLADWAAERFKGALRGAWGVGAAVAVVAGLAALSMAGLSIDRLPLSESEITSQRLMLYETYSNNIGTTIRWEYLPREMEPRPYTSGVQLNGGSKPAPLALEGRLESAEALSITPEKEVWTITVAAESLLAFHTTYLSGWEATVDGQAQGVEPLAGLGLVGLRLQGGAHQVTLTFRATPTRSLAGWVSSVAALFWLALAGNPLRNSPRARHRALLALGVMAILGLWLLEGPHAITAAPPSGPVVMDFARAPYLHAEPGGIDFGSLHLDSYALSATEAQPGDTVTVTLNWAQAVPEAEVVVQWMAATAHLYQSAPTWARASQKVAERRTVLALTLPDDLPPGLYVPRLKVIIGEDEPTPTAANGAGMAKLALQPVQVHSAPLEPVDATEPRLGEYGPEGQAPVIALATATASQTEDDRVELTLVWRSLRQAPLNYQLSVRLYRPDGSLVKDRDLPPLLGGYPTSLWRPGERITDRVKLDFSGDEILDAGYTLEVVLYDRATLQAAGTARVPLTLTD
jgi:hypothetical protein